ncbi:PAS/LOV protein B, PAS/LOV PROTEIN C, PAS/LOV PROTEIN A, PAS/LOV PROTEIN [Hibiscus trionum]|uniref:PAS/LOV protein B, PAS/LOV PROTEIN C, PAS/LOV PROTEIN A, PAS/LOV PROTEIN n=1 Tax=Hibiscus trionum TaxID=183268 RepID=A0A9W7MQ08_HIBTR|nr:PAS/LOV protein B, PAS/LOV PROTEIN C, PAS/LOV PROTEIN A, PAS/LOV PROTEIN [Hibiscus trionum]
MDSKLGLIQQSFNSRYSQWVREALDELPDNFTITDPSIPGHPIVFASRNFLKILGYSQEEVIGQNGNIFQGPKTNRRTVMEIREAIREERGVQVSLVNYRKDGTPFWMLFHMSPVFGKEDGRVIHFVAVQVPITRRQRRNGGVSLSDDASGLNEIMFGSCRKEVDTNSVLELGRVLSLNSSSNVLDIEETCEASDFEQQRAVNAFNNILSVLTHYSESTGRLVCGKRCSAPGVGYISSSLNISLGRIKQSFVLIDPHLPGLPIVYASDAFLKLTGYDRHEILGLNFAVLNGADTDTSSLHQINESIQTEQACTVRILSYRKDQSSFWNCLHLSPVRNASGKIAYFVGVQIDEECKNTDRHGLSPEMRQLSTVGAVKVAVRSLSMAAGSSKS